MRKKVDPVSRSILGTSALLRPLAYRMASGLKSRQGRFAVLAYDFSSGDSLLVDAHAVFPAASLIKLPVMMGLMEQVETGQFSLDESIGVRTTYRSMVDSSEFRVEATARLKRRATYRQVMKAMIEVSDNAAANTLIQFLGVEKMEEFLLARGYRETKLVRCLMDLKADELGIGNTTTAYDVMRMLRDIQECRGYRPESRGEMLQVLEAQTHNDKIPAGLPPGTPVAHKTGRIAGVEHDAGIVYLASGTYVLVFMSDSLSSSWTGVDAARMVSRECYEHFDRSMLRKWSSGQTLTTARSDGQSGRQPTKAGS
jgi:beta-lactamase class A